jgi:hypothetical protein
MFGLQVASLATYNMVLYDASFLSLASASLLVLALLIWLLYDLAKLLAPKPDELAEIT